jgi:hypothetical protein
VLNDEIEKKISLKKDEKNQVNPDEFPKPALISQTHNK